MLLLRYHRDIKDQSVQLYSVAGCMILTLLSFHLQLEDAEFAAQSALKGKKKLEEDVADLQSQLDILSKSKKEVTQTSPANLKGFYHERPFEKSINQKTLRSNAWLYFKRDIIVRYTFTSFGAKICPKLEKSDNICYVKIA